MTSKGVPVYYGVKWKVAFREISMGPMPGNLEAKPGYRVLQFMHMSHMIVIAFSPLCNCSFNWLDTNVYGVKNKIKIKIKNKKGRGGREGPSLTNSIWHATMQATGRILR